jgi:uncharacterized repeat protein (TIGR01451 family)
MNKFTTITATSLISLVVAGSVVSPAYAWHPKGQITKSVQNMTAGDEAKDANDAAAALATKPGDVLQYTIEVSNIAAPADQHYNDLAFTVMTDTLPSGVELVSDPSVRDINVDMGTILPGKSITKQYQVKVTADKDATVIENKACFTADSVVKDNPQNGCDIADVKVIVPVVTPTPTPTPISTPTSTPSPTPKPKPTPVVPASVSPTDPTTPVAPAQPEVLPNTGVGSTAAVAAIATSILGYLGYALRLKRRASA